jgi:tritrans,polycis-undecaprenyl-diphosphate synthase [geranylgeranyl-diphosphate specific]
MSWRLFDPAYALYERLLRKEIVASGSIEHVAVIQDGNRRYARERGLAKQIGHSLGAKTTEMVLDWCLELGLKHITLYAFSTENFKRDEEERRYLFELIDKKFKELYNSKKIYVNRIRVRAIGRIDLLPADLVETISRLDDATKGFDNLFLNVALAYGGQGELVDAARALARQIKEGRIKAEEISEQLVAQSLYPYDGHPVPKVDLIIRTGGEYRTSNFLPWQANGNECAAYFCAPYWPEFRKVDFMRAIRTAQAIKAGRGQQA